MSRYTVFLSVECEVGTFSSETSVISGLVSRLKRNYISGDLPAPDKNWVKKIDVMMVVQQEASTEAVDG